MLKLGEVSFTQGRVIYLDRREEMPEPTAKIFVPLILGDTGVVIYAQLDTGAAWSILEFAIARSLGLLDNGADLTSLDTRFGTLRGHLVRIPVQFLADEGEPFETEGTFFVSPDWPGRTFLGYSGLLDSLRFALDPRLNHFYFGPG